MVRAPARLPHGAELASPLSGSPGQGIEMDTEKKAFVPPTLTEEESLADVTLVSSGVVRRPTPKAS